MEVGWEEVKGGRGEGAGQEVAGDGDVDGSGIAAAKIKNQRACSDKSQARNVTLLGPNIGI